VSGEFGGSGGAFLDVRRRRKESMDSLNTSWGPTRLDGVMGRILMLRGIRERAGHEVYVDEVFAESLSIRALLAVDWMQINVCGGDDRVKGLLVDDDGVGE